MMNRTLSLEVKVVGGTGVVTVMKAEEVMVATGTGRSTELRHLRTEAP